MKAHGVFVAFVHRQRVAHGRREAVLAVERAAVRGKPQGSVVDHVEGAGIAVMRDGEMRAVRLFLARET